MKAASIISFVLAGIFVLFSALFILGSFSPQGSAGWLFTGIIGLLIAFAFIVAGAFFGKKNASQNAAQNVTLKVDLPGQVKLDSMKCQACGAPLSATDITMVNGAPMVSCHSCGTTYQLSEEPKW